MSNLCEKVTADLAKGVLAMEARKRRVGRVRFPSVGDSILSLGSLYEIVDILPDDKIDNGQLKTRYSCSLCGSEKVYSLWGSSPRLVGSLCLGNSSPSIAIWAL